MNSLNNTEGLCDWVVERRDDKYYLQLMSDESLVAQIKGGVDNRKEEDGVKPDTVNATFYAWVHDLVDKTRKFGRNC